MPLHRRTLLPHPGGHGDCDDWHGGGYGCSPPPSPPIVIPPPPVASPSPPPPSIWQSSWPCPPSFLAPSPSPTFHGAAGGRRDQHGYGPPAGGGGGGGHADEHRRRIITLIVVGTAVLAFLSLILLGVSVAVRRRQQRRRHRQQSLLAPAAAAAAVAANFDDSGGNDDPEGGGGGGGVVHHIWYIRTVGLDEVAIESIAATRYRAGTGLLGAADCSVCLGEFQDGELVRLLPKCGHAFHVPCIDTWLRAHVNCPLCRSDVLDPAAESAGGESSSIPQTDPGSNTSAAPGDAILECEEAQEGEQEDQETPPPPPHMEENREERPGSLDPLPLPPPRNVRRAASMDAMIVSTAADVAALERLPETAALEEEEQRGGDKRVGAPGASRLKVSSSGRLSNLSAGERLPRLFFSRHCRARSSVLPL